MVQNINKAQNVWKTISRLASRLHGQRVRLTVVAISIVIYVGLSIWNPLYSARVIDLLWNSVQTAWKEGTPFAITWDHMGKELVQLTIQYFFTWIFYYLQSYLMANVAETLTCTLRTEISRKLNRLPLRFFDRNKAGEILSRVTSDLDKIAEVLQDTWLFGGTIAENIAYGKEDATREEIIAAAKAAKVDYFIRTMPKGYDTVLDNEASNLSAGQKQLLTIARVFLCDPPILILDEATSSVDTRTEVEIGKAMKKLMKGRTSFVIAHRLSTIRDADMILFMEKGNIIEQGNHKELLEKQGAYAKLYYSQFE